MTSKFNNSDFESNDGMLTYVWGPPFWHFLHTMSFNYPIYPTNEDKDKYEIFIRSIGFILPCKYCRENFSKNLISINFRRNDFKSRDTFSLMIYNLHNEVNRQLKKKNNITYNEVKSRYEHFRSRCNMKILNENTVPYNGAEKGCTEPEHGLIKTSCKVMIVPWNKKNINSIEISKECNID